MKTSYQWTIVSCLIGAMSLSAEPPSVPWVLEGKEGMVAADSPYASYAGLLALQAGGNAIDAAAAVSFALAATRPDSTGLGGGGFMIARMADGKIIVQDFRESAPAAATPDMFVKAVAKDPDGPSPSQYGYLSVAVPGLVAGRCEAVAKWGTLPLAKVLEPAIDLAKRGFSLDHHNGTARRRGLKLLEKNPPLEKYGSYIRDTFFDLPKGDRAAQRVKLPGLTATFEGIARDGADFFYKGPVAKSLADAMKKNGGIITESDLASYKVISREPLRTTYRNYEIIGMPPPSSGGVALAQALNMLEVVDYASVVKKDAALGMHYQIEALKHAFADRSRWLGDADFAQIPVAALTSKAYAKKLAGRFDAAKVIAVEQYGSASLPDDAGTSHFVVADKHGNVVVSTETINTDWGSFVTLPEWGLIFNNEMDDFVSEPGKPNAFDLVQSDRNAIAPGKRPLSSMAPTIVLKNKKPYLMLGASGGPRIISSVLHVMLAVLDRDMPLGRVLVDPRPHQQWQPDEVYFDRDADEALVESLRSRGHKVSSERRSGVVQAILRARNGWIGASDPRKGGRPKGY